MSAKPITLEPNYLKSILRPRKNGIYVPLYIVVVLTLSVISIYVVLLQQIHNINISFTQNLAVPYDIINSSLMYERRKNDIHIIQKIQMGEKFQKDQLMKNCYKKTLSHIMKQVDAKYVNGSKEIEWHVSNDCEHSKITCQNSLVGLVPVNLTSITLPELKKVKKLATVQKGGWWLPSNCSLKQSVAIVIPYRDRSLHLALFLKHMHPILQRQNLHYRIFVIEQIDKYKFNRGKLMNVGFREALKFFPYNCFVFHDVDLLLENDHNHYGCLSSPQHMSTAINKFNYRILYEELFGGIEMFLKRHFELVNGFSNSFWGWGAEDDNILRRLRWKNLPLWRASVTDGRYHMIKHVDREGAADMSRFPIRSESYKHYATDGLVNLQYDVNDVREMPYHTHIEVDLRKDKDLIFGVKPYPFKQSDFN